MRSKNKLRMINNMLLRSDPRDHDNTMFCAKIGATAMGQAWTGV
jgi:hypothetical protein